MKTKELQEIVNSAFDAVNDSKVGPIYSGARDDKGNPVINPLAYHTFLHIVTNLVPTISVNRMQQSGELTMREPGEEWRGQ